MLNAFRHQRINHSLLRAFLFLTGLCAQRLSASKDKSLRELGVDQAVKVVLNAFRHQRINHAQLGWHHHRRHHWVLNAFRHQRINHVVDHSGCIFDLSAQRLSASKDKSLKLNSGRATELEVLNAFRHQRINHRANDHSRSARGQVLNAFRHQRINHTAGFVATIELADWCSTPFGIKG